MPIEAECKAKRTRVASSLLFVENLEMIGNGEEHDAGEEYEGTDRITSWIRMDQDYCQIRSQPDSALKRY